MPEWIPRPSSTKGRLALTALEVFGTDGYDDVNVVELARRAGVTTGALYHHFGNKLGLYRVVREEAQRRVLDRMRGAAAARADDGRVASARAALLVGFDVCVEQGLCGLMGAPDPGADADPVAAFLADLADENDVPVSRLLTAAWREALHAVTQGVDADRARHALQALTISAA